MFGIPQFDKNKFSAEQSYFGQKPSGTYRVRKTSGAGKDGLKTTYSRANYYDKNAQDPRIAAFATQQQAYQQQLQATADASAAANTKQLQILQGERSAISKMTQEYSAMLQQEADAKAKAQEEARISAATSAANQARQGGTPNLQIQAASSTPKTGGTDAFRIRKRQGSKQKQLASSLNIGQSNTLNI